MKFRTTFIVSSIVLLSGCVYPAGPGGYSNAGYAPGSPYYNGYSYSPYYNGYSYQPGYQTVYQPAQTTYVYRSAPSAYPLYSPTFPSRGSGGYGG